MCHHQSLGPMSALNGRAGLPMTSAPTGHLLAYVSLVAATGGFLFGYDTAVINGANPYISAYFSLDPLQEGLTGASAILGCIPGALIGGFLSDRSGRKKVLFVCALLFAISGIASALPTTFAAFLSARFLGGIAIGISSMVCPVYIGECAPAAVRGRLGTLFQLGIVVGIFLTFFLNAAIQGSGDHAWNVAFGWRWMLAAEVLPAGLLLYVLPRSPESPRWLIQKGRDDEARGILTHWVDSAAIESEVAGIRAVAERETGHLSELFARRFRRPLIIAVGIAVVAQLSGINAVMYYSTRIFTAAGVGIGDAFTATVLIGFVNLVFTLAAVSLVDRAGRRLLLLIGLLLQVLSLSAVAWLLASHATGAPLLVAILIFIASFAIALGPIPWLLGSEVFPAKIRGRAMSLVSFSVWVSCYAVAQTFPMLNDSPAIGPAKTFCIYAAVSAAGLIFTYFWVPETKGRTLEEIETSWSSAVPAGK
ncbi:MAG: sugar transporter [Gammaproteobacteria bacterium]|nr:sugar transporter [Gammaproteobacteria bacterium]